jgi:chromosome segregation ATPase
MSNEKTDDPELVQIIEEKEGELEYCKTIIDELDEKYNNLLDRSSEFIEEFKSIVDKISEDYLEHTDFETQQELVSHYADKGDEQ